MVKKYLEEGEHAYTVAVINHTLMPHAMHKNNYVFTITVDNTCVLAILIK